jgi:hypothetical protein
MPAQLLGQAKKAIPAIVDEIAFQARRPLGERALASIIPFSRDDWAAIRHGGALLQQLRAPRDLPPRFLVSAAGRAIEAGVDPRALNEVMLSALAPANQPASNVIKLKAA